MLTEIGILTNAEKRKQAEDALLKWPKLSNRAIAKKVGVSNPFVKKLRPDGSNFGEYTRRGADGKLYHFRITKPLQT